MKVTAVFYSEPPQRPRGEFNSSINNKALYINIRDLIITHMEKGSIL